PVKVQLSPGALERVLHQCVCAGAIADQRARIAAQPWDQLDQALRFIQGEQPSSAAYSTLFGLARQWRQTAQVCDERIEIRWRQLARRIPHYFTHRVAEHIAVGE